MRFYFDTEFMEDGHTIDPLSIGIVSEDNREYYAEFNTADLTKANEFVRETVFPNLRSYNPLQPNRLFTELDLKSYNPGFSAKSPHIIKHEILAFCGDSPEFWAYFADYDWVVICQIFGRMVDLPREHGWPMFCLDLKQEMYLNSIPKALIERDFLQPTTHNALDDARWVKNAHQWVRDYIWRLNPNDQSS